MEGLKLAPADSELRKTLDEMLRDARSRMMGTRAAAAPAGRLPAGSPSAAEATRLEQEAARLEKGGQLDKAISTMWLAADAFAYASEDARRTAARVEPSAASPASSGGQRRTELPPAPTVARGASVPESTAAPSPPPAAPPPLAAPADERSAIARLLRAYEQAYSSLDANGVVQVFPSVDRDGLKKGFDGMRSMQVQLQSEQIRVEGTTAAVTGTWVTTARAKVGSSVQQGSASIELRLQKSANGWIIVSRSMR
jgi:ketosteroid isomerase-like protein